MYIWLRGPPSPFSQKGCMASDSSSESRIRSLFRYTTTRRNKMATLIIKTTTNKIVSTEQPWYDRLVDKVVDSVKDVQRERQRIADAAKIIAPFEDAAREQRARAKAVAWAKSKGYDIAFED